MSRKQNWETVRKDYERITADLYVWAVSKDGEPVARIVVKYGGRTSPNGLTVRAFVHIWGLQMTRGIARGGGYDMRTAALATACSALPEIPEGNILRAQQPLMCAAVDDFRRVVDQGYDVPRQLEAMGYRVQGVM